MAYAKVKLVPVIFIPAPEVGSVIFGLFRLHSSDIEHAQVRGNKGSGFVQLTDHWIRLQVRTGPARNNRDGVSVSVQECLKPVDLHVEIAQQLKLRQLTDVELWPPYDSGEVVVPSRDEDLVITWGRVLVIDPRSVVFSRMCGSLLSL